ncbi:MAG: CHC2 zinc finger domain-containing protein [Rhodospirillales bacterium]
MSERLIDFTELRRRAHFEPVLAHYKLKLVGRGSQRSVLCPFHSEKNPSCKVNLEKGIFRCFGCGAKGNVLDFVQHMEDASLTDAAEMLARICSVELPLRDGERAEGAHHPKRARTPQDARNDPSIGKTTAPVETTQGEASGEPEGVVNPPLTFALKLDPAHPYLVERGLGPEIVEAFGLGYSNRGMMKGRICIPIHNETGELVAYAGRWAGDEGWPEGEDKYRLPPNFRKSHVLYNLNRISDPSYCPRSLPLGWDRACVVLVEGFFSVFRLHALGVPAVALMGCSISEQQVALLTGHSTRVIALFDGDAAGRKARNEVVPLLADRLFVHAPLLPEGASPDDLDEGVLRAALAIS